MQHRCAQLQGRFRTADQADYLRCIDFFRPNSRDARMDRHGLCRHRQSLLGLLSSIDYHHRYDHRTRHRITSAAPVLRCVFRLIAAACESSQSQRDRVDKIAVVQSSEITICRTSFEQNCDCAIRLVSCCQICCVQTAADLVITNPKSWTHELPTHRACQLLSDLLCANCC